MSLLFRWRKSAMLLSMDDYRCVPHSEKDVLRFHGSFAIF